MDDQSPPPEATPDAPADEPSIGPKEVSLLTILLRTVSGLGGGIIGTGVLLVIAVLASAILKSALGAGDGETVHPLFVFVFMIMVFLGSTLANLLGPLFIALTDREKYKFVSTTLTQIFIANIVILIVVAPVYVVIAGVNIGVIASVAALQIVVSAFSSALILELIADARYALLGVYSTALAVLVSSGVNFLLYSISRDNPAILLFVALPIIWLSIGLFSGLLGFLYGWIYKLYGVDFLSRTVTYGQDDRWISEAEETALEEQAEQRSEAVRKDDGASFLNKG